MDGWGEFFAIGAVVILAAIAMVILFVRAVVIAIRGRKPSPEDPGVPAARVVRDRSKPS